jgi:hypothetical protein
MTIKNSTWNGIAVGPNSDGQFIIGQTYATGGDMTYASAGQGVCLTAAAPFALSVYADDNETAIASGWVSTGFFSYVNFAAQATGSAFALTGQLHIGADFTACDNIGGVFGVVECDSAEAVNAHVFGGMFAVNVSAGTYGSGYSMAGVCVSGRQSGATTSGLLTGVHFEGGTGYGLDAAMSFGHLANSDMTGCGADLTAHESTTILGHVIVYLGSTKGYINVWTTA